MKGSVKQGGLPETLVRSFQLPWQGGTVVIATGFKLQEFPEEDHPNVKSQDAVGRITHSVPLKSSFCLRRSLATCPVGQQIQTSPPWDNQESQPPSKANLPPEQRNFLYTRENLPGSKRSLNVTQSHTWEPKICVMSMLNSLETAECSCYSFVSQSNLST